MSDHPHPLTAEEAAQAMISEGAPLGQPHEHSSPSAWDEAVECAQTQLNDTVRKHPLTSLLVAFGVGLMVGNLFSRD